jgi:hypothetical protein
MPLKELRELIGALGRVVSARPKMGKLIRRHVPEDNPFQKPE